MTALLIVLACCAPLAVLALLVHYDPLRRKVTPSGTADTPGERAARATC